MRPLPSALNLNLNRNLTPNLIRFLAPVLSSPGFGTNGNFQFTLTSTSNTVFGIKASTNLTNWTTIGSGTTGTNGFLIFQDTNSAGIPARYYRAYWPFP